MHLRRKDMSSDSDPGSRACKALCCGQFCLRTADNGPYLAFLRRHSCLTLARSNLRKLFCGDQSRRLYAQCKKTCPYINAVIMTNFYLTLVARSNLFDGKADDALLWWLVLLIGCRCVGPGRTFSALQVVSLSFLQPTPTNVR